MAEKIPAGKTRIAEAASAMLIISSFSRSMDSKDFSLARIL